MNLKKFILFWSLLFTVNVIAQQANDNTITISRQNAPLSEVIKLIEENSKYTFFYDAAKIDINQKVNLDVKSAPIQDAVTQMLSKTNIRFEVSNSQIVLYPKSAPAKKEGALKTVSGRVIDETGETLIGVVIAVKGKSTGTVTDFDGNFSLEVNPKDEILFSYVGYATKEFPATVLGQGSQITMGISSQQMQEVVVVGYGSQKRASVVGAITSLEPAKLNVSTTRSLSNDLAGNIAGVIAVQRSGEPGYDNSEFWIRGISTFKGAGKNPLVLVDGIERSLNDIDIAEIESFSVLKDASATAVYGVRGANGVILITTKKGKVGKTSIQVSVEHSITKPQQLPKFLNSADYLTLLNRIHYQDLPYVNDGYTPVSDEVIGLYRSHYDRELYPDVNWLDAITNSTANNTRVSFDLNGGSEKLRYSFVGAYYNESGITTSDPSKDWNSDINLNRFNLRSNVDVNITSTTTLTFNLGGYLQRRNAPEKGIDAVFDQAFTTPPHVIPTRYADGRIPKPDHIENPWAFLTQTGFQRNAKSNFESLFVVDQDLKDLLDGLKIKGIFSFDYFTENAVKRAGNPVYYKPASGRDFVTGALQFSAPPSDGQEFLDYKKEAEYGTNSTYFEANLSYDRTFNSKHYINALFLYNQRDYDNGEKVPFRHQGIAGRAAYTYLGKYVAEFNFGYNGSENFAPGKRYGFFPSVAVGWILSEEAFMESLNKTFNKIKFRASYGLVGNDQLDGRRFAYQTTISETDEYQFGNSSSFSNIKGLREGDVGIPDLTWETVKKANLGIEFGLWRMIDLQVDFFHERRENIFMQRNQYPNSAGFPVNPWANFGVVTNKGFDIALDVNKQITKDWFVSARGSATYARNKIIEQDEDIAKIGTYRSGTGKPVGQIFGLIADGVFTDDDFVDVNTGELKPGIPKHKFTDRVYPGDIKYRDMDNDDEITMKDQTAIGGTENPELVYGFGLNTSFKGFDFGFFMQGNGRTYRMIGKDNTFLPGSTSGARGNIFTNATDAWTVDNPRSDAFYPRLHIGYNANNSQESTWWLKDMSVLRLKNMEVGYTFPKKLIQKAAMEHARVFLRGTNLFHFSDFKLWDPELNTDDGLKYPIMASYSMGVQVKF